MTVLEQRRWIKEWHALAGAVLRYREAFPALAEWEKVMVPGREREFSLICLNEEHRCPMVSISIPRNLRIEDDEIGEWAAIQVKKALDGVDVYLAKELWRRQLGV